MKNNLKRGKACIGQTVIDSEGNKALITDMYTKNGSKCLVRLKYSDGIEHEREKFFVSQGKFVKPGAMHLEEDLTSDFWKPLKGYEKFYLLSKAGDLVRIKGKNSFKKKIATKRNTGYCTFTLYKDGKDSVELVYQHRIVIETFIRPLKEGEEVNHIDGDRTNNNLYNLEILTKKENNKKYIDLSAFGLTKISPPEQSLAH